MSLRGLLPPPSTEHLTFLMTGERTLSGGGVLSRERIERRAATIDGVPMQRLFVGSTPYRRALVLGACQIALVALVGPRLGAQDTASAPKTSPAVPAGVGAPTTPAASP